MASVELQVYPPLSYKLTSKRVGALTLREEIRQGGTLGDLLARLAASNPEAWGDIFDARTNQVRRVILIVVNRTAVSPSLASQASLSEGDQIALRLPYSGG